MSQLRLLRRCRAWNWPVGRPLTSTGLLASEQTDMPISFEQKAADLSKRVDNKALDPTVWSVSLSI